VSDLFISPHTLGSCSWQAFERALCRLLMAEGWDGVRLVGQSNDHGADVIAHRYGKRWLFQVKRWKSKVGVAVLDETLSALRLYRAQVPVVVALKGFDQQAREHQAVLLSRGTPLQLWGPEDLLRRVGQLPDRPPHEPRPRPYQEQAIQAVVHSWQESFTRRAMVVMATGLGKTYTAAEIVRRVGGLGGLRVLVLAHTNELVYQLERAFWPFLKPSQETLVWNGYERPSPDDVERSPLVFACLNSVATHVEAGGTLPAFDIVLIDECHHVGGSMYERIIMETRAGQPSGPFLLGLTATPWRPDETDLSVYFGDPLFTMDMVTGLKLGFLSNVDYRMYTDNINWSALPLLQGARLSPRQINRTLFISEWDNAVVRQLQEAWHEQQSPRAIVFCGTIDHAITMRDQINAMGFCNAAAIYSQTTDGSMHGWERNRILCDFQDGTVNVICAVDVFNEGLDVPDVNLIVFQRVTHSRRIFIQQLGRGLRLSEGKEKVIVLDFVSDIRRFAAGINLQNELRGSTSPAPSRPMRIRLQHNVTFRRSDAEDPRSESFLREWLEDVATIEHAGDDASVLKFPPDFTDIRS
jgi:superfamily II DNA or RNA helicase